MFTSQHSRAMTLLSIFDSSLSSSEIWLLVGVALCILEVLTPGFILACFGIGSLATMLPAALDLGLTWQIITFCLVSFASLLLLRPFIQGLSKGKNLPKTGVEALIGRQVIVKETIQPGLIGGLVSIDGDVWQARTEDGTSLETGQVVEVIRQESLILFVRPI